MTLQIPSNRCRDPKETAFHPMLNAFGRIVKIVKASAGCMLRRMVLFIFSPRVIFFDLSPGRAIKRSNYKLPVQEAVPLLISIEAVASAKTLVVRKIGDHLPRACSWMGRPMATYLEAIARCVCVDQKVI